MPMTMADNDNNDNDDDDANDDRDDDEPPSTKLTWRRAIFHVDVWLAPPIEGAIRPTTIIKIWNFTAQLCGW